MSNAAENPKNAFDYGGASVSVETGTMNHVLIDPPDLASPVGCSHGVATSGGKLVFLGGQTAQTADSTVRGETMADQFEIAVGNLMRVLKAAGGEPQDLTWLQIFVTDASEYRSQAHQIGVAYRSLFGYHYPTMSLFEVRALFDPAAKVEMVGMAVCRE